jgi:8-oxo-dGTP pyrophosphatase MutT (NUDIX family)
MFNFCPSCASQKIRFEDGKVFRCPDCGFVYYHNIAAATGCVISVPDSGTERIVFLIRSKQPSVGRLDLPGGFVDIGEGTLDGLYRELREEIGWTPPIPAGAKLASVFKLFASFPNVYEYRGVKYNTCDMYFSISAPSLKVEELRLEQSEISDVCFLKPEEIDYDKLAFESTRRAVRAYLDILD